MIRNNDTRFIRDVISTNDLERYVASDLKPPDAKLSPIGN